MRRIFVILSILLWSAAAHASDYVSSYYNLVCPEEGSMDWTTKFSQDIVSIDSALQSISNDLASGKVSHDVELSSYSIDGDGYVRIDADNDGTNEWTFSESGDISHDSASNYLKINKGGNRYVNFYPAGSGILFLGENAGVEVLDPSTAIDNNTGTIGIGKNCLNSLISNTAGAPDIAIGEYAAYSQTSVNDNISIGKQAAYGGNTGAQNISIGRQAAYGSGGITWGTIAIGYQAGKNASSNYCTYLGYQAGYNNTERNMIYIATGSTFDAPIKANGLTRTVWLNDYVYISRDTITRHLSTDIISADCIAAKYGVISIDATRVKLTDLKGRNFTSDAITSDVISSERLYFQSRPPATSPDLPASGRGVLYMSSDGTLKFGSSAGGWHEVLNFYTK